MTIISTSHTLLSWWSRCWAQAEKETKSAPVCEMLKSQYICTHSQKVTLISNVTLAEIILCCIDQLLFYIQSRASIDPVGSVVLPFLLLLIITHFGKTSEFQRKEPVCTLLYFYSMLLITHNQNKYNTQVLNKYRCSLTFVTVEQTNNHILCCVLFSLYRICSSPLGWSIPKP